MDKKKISPEEYQKALQVISDYKSQLDFFGKVSVRHSGQEDDVTHDYFNSLERLAMFCYELGEKGDVMGEVVQICEDEFNQHELPF